MSDSNFKDIEDLFIDLKNGMNIWEDFILKASKFSNSIKSMTSSCSIFFDSMLSLSNVANKSCSGIQSTSVSLTKLVLRERKVEMKANSFSDVLNDNFVVELEKHLIDWQKSLTVMKKEHDLEWKRATMEYQKSVSDMGRLEKKLRKKNCGKVGLPETASLQLDYASKDCNTKRRYMEDLERCTLRRVALDERRRFKQLIYLMKPVLDCQLSIREDLNNLDEVITLLYGIKAENLDMLPEELEQSILNHSLYRHNGGSLFSGSHSTLASQHKMVLNGSKLSLNSNSRSTTSSECNYNATPSSLIESPSNSHLEEDIKVDIGVIEEHTNDTNKEHIANEPDQLPSINKDNSDYKSLNEDDEGNDISTDPDSRDITLDNDNDLFPLPMQLEIEDLPIVESESLPPAPPPLLTKQSFSILDRKKLSESLYPNQSIPSPIYANLTELKINADKKLCAMSCDRYTNKETNQTPSDNNDVINAGDVARQMPITMVTNGHSETVNDRSIFVRGMLGSSDLREKKQVNIAPPSLYRNSNENNVSTFGTVLKLEQSLTNASLNFQNEMVNVKSPVFQRPLFSTMTRPNVTPLSPNTIRRPSAPDYAPAVTNRNKGRSLSVTREISHNSTDEGKQTENFSDLRQKLASHINNELKSQLSVKEEDPKNEPSSSHNIINHSRVISSPRMTRSIKERVEIPKAAKSPAIFYPPFKSNLPPDTRSMTQDVGSTFGEQKVDKDPNMTNNDSNPAPESRKEDQFKKQLMQVLQKPKFYDNTRINHNKSEKPQPAETTSSSLEGSNIGNRFAPLCSKPKTKTSIPTSKYGF